MPPTLISRLSFLLPIFSALFAVVIISTCVALAKQHGHVPPFIRYPPISLAGIEPPEYALFASGFACISALLWACEALFWASFSPRLPPPSPALAALGLHPARWAARLGFLGLAVTGVVPLQGWGELATLAHVTGSLAFFAASLHHGYTFCVALSSAALAGHPLHSARRPWLWRAKAAMLANGFCSFLPAQLLHPGGSPVAPHAGGPEAAELDRGGFAQWWMVGSLVAYYSLFSVDLYLLAREGGGLAEAGGEAAQLRERVRRLKELLARSEERLAAVGGEARVGGEPAAETRNKQA